MIDADNTAGDVGADTAYRSAKNEAWLASRGLVSCIHRKKPPGRPMPVRIRQANARKSVVRSAVRHLLELAENRHDRGATLITDNPILADAILDRLIHNAHRI